MTPPILFVLAALAVIAFLCALAAFWTPRAAAPVPRRVKPRPRPVPPPPEPQPRAPVERDDVWGLQWYQAATQTQGLHQATTQTTVSVNGRTFESDDQIYVLVRPILGFPGVDGRIGEMIVRGTLNGVSGRWYIERDGQQAMIPASIMRELIARGDAVDYVRSVMPDLAQLQDFTQLLSGITAPTGVGEPKPAAPPKAVAPPKKPEPTIYELIMTDDD